MAKLVVSSKFNLSDLYQELVQLELMARGLKSSVKNALSKTEYKPIQTLYGIGKWASSEAAASFEEDLEKTRTAWLKEWR